MKGPRHSRHTDTDISQRGSHVRIPPSQGRERKNLESTQSPPRASRGRDGGEGMESERLGVRFGRGKKRISKEDKYLMESEWKLSVETYVSHGLLL